jgi:hypothetical protein
VKFLFVPPGVYREHVVVGKNDLTVSGRPRCHPRWHWMPGPTGIRGRASRTGGTDCGATLTGLTIRNYSRAGILQLRTEVCEGSSLGSNGSMVDMSGHST